jgi:putative transposase
LWQDRYYSCALDDQHFWAAVRYVELNPVRAGIFPRAEEYRWSSARAHCGLEASSLVDSKNTWSARLQKMPDWSSYLRSGRDEAQLALIRQATSQNKAAGSQAFLETMKELTGRDSARRSQGRPKSVLERQSSRIFVVPPTSH